MGIVDIKNVGGIVSGIGDLAIKIRKAITGIDPDKQAEITIMLADLETKIALGQLELNKIEAASSNLFKSGWRPFIGWTCGISFALNFVLLPIVSWILNLAKVDIKLFTLDLTTMLPVLLGMLGLGGYRTFEKYKGVK